MAPTPTQVRTSKAGLLCREPGVARGQSRCRRSRPASRGSWRRPRPGWSNWTPARSRAEPPSRPGKGFPPCGWGQFSGCSICTPGFRRGSGGFRRELVPGRSLSGHYGVSRGCQPRLNWWLWISGGRAGTEPWRESLHARRAAHDFMQFPARTLLHRRAGQGARQWARPGRPPRSPRSIVRWTASLVPGVCRVRSPQFRKLCGYQHLAVCYTDQRNGPLGGLMVVEHASHDCARSDGG